MAAEPTSPAQPPQLPTAGSLAGILDVLETDDDFRALIAGEIEEPESDIDPSITVGVPDGLRPALAAGAAGKQPVVLVVASSREAEETVESIRSWYDGDPNDVAQLEAWETLPHERLSPRADTVASRMAVFRRLKHPEEGSTLFGPIRILVMPVRSLIQPVVAGLGDVEPLVFSQGEELPLDEASRKLVENAYTRVDLVMDRGEFAVRGGIIDVFPPTLPHPVRIEFFGDEIDTIREFHASDQRTYGKDISTVWATPCRELQLTDQIRQRAKSLIGSIPNAEDMLESIANAIPVEGMESLLPALVDDMEPVQGMLPKHALVMLSDPEKLRRAADDLAKTANEFLAASWHVAASGHGAETPKLNKLGGSDWAATKAKARKHVHEIAEDLVKLYSARQRTKGYAFSKDTPWQKELEDAFPYQETADQLTTIDEVKSDMEKPIPMDRLICGDVGFGKTEIAVRAAFKAVQDSKQVAVLVPTTLLVQQHFETFTERFEGFPVNVAAMSRFQTTKEINETIKGLEDGSVDVVIGTHKLLNPKIKFKDLGLVIIDEEQRFGVEHKETLKALRTNVDVLSLSATPIPRTLEMAVTGIREMSTLATPPEDRLPVLTYVGAYEDAQVTAAIRRELLRGGQVFYVHNRVQDISSVAAKIHELVPESHVGIAHGKMGEKQLDGVIRDFWHRDIDVLVCTTIIETGLDISNANTLIVDHADRFGLSQLHQLRGRVGRGRERAYAYFLYDPTKPMTQQSHDRLVTIAQNTALGSGFDVAMKDLELRGTGNLLGDEQSGHIEGVGFDLYVRMVSEAVEQYKEPERKESVAVTIDLPIEASIPVDYIDSDKLRLEAYQKLASARTEDDLDELRDELTDRYGKPPVDFEALFDVARLRFKARKLGISEIIAQGRNVRVSKFEPRESVQMRMARIYKGIQYRPLTKTYLVPAPFASSLGSKPMSSDEVVGWTSPLLDDLDWKPTPRQ